MTRKLLLVATLVVACGGGQKPCPPPAASAGPLTPEAVVTAGRGIVERYRQAYEVRSLEALAAVYSQTLDVVVVHQGKSWQGWSAVAAHLEELLAEAVAVHASVSDVSVVALGPEGAAVSAQLDREIAGQVTTVKESGILTLALRLEGDRWVVVGEHFSYRPSVE